MSKITINREVEFSTDEGKTWTSYPITYTYGANTFDESRDTGGWINGQVEIDGRMIDVGGGWVEADGSVKPYGYSELGDLNDLMDALGLDADNELDIEAVKYQLKRSLPSTFGIYCRALGGTTWSAEIDAGGERDVTLGRFEAGEIDDDGQVDIDRDEIDAAMRDALTRSWGYLPPITITD